MADFRVRSLGHALPLQGVAARVPVLVWIAAGLALLATLDAAAPLRLGLVTAALSLLMLAGMLRLVLRSQGVEGAAMPEAVLAHLQGDPAPHLLLDADMSVLWANPAADTLLPELARQGLPDALRPLLADPAATLAAAEAILDRAPVAEVASGQLRLALRKVEGGLRLLRLDTGGNRTEPERRDRIPGLVLGPGEKVLSITPALRDMLGRRPDMLGDVLAGQSGVAGGIVDVARPGESPRRLRLYRFDRGEGREDVLLLPPGEEGDAGAVAVDSLPVALVELARDGAVLLANPAARRLLHLGADEPPPVMSELVTGLGRDVIDWLNKSLDAPHPLQPEVLRVRRAPDESFLQITLGAAQGPEGDRLVAVLHDATELKTLEAQFVQSQKMQAIGQLAGGVAHDFNNLLTAISGHCDLMLLRHDPGDSDYSDLMQITQNANRAAALVGQLLAFSRKQTLLPEVLDVRDALADLTHLLNRLVGETVTLSLLHDPDLPTVRADRRQLEQVVMNLVVNARDAMPEGGDIVIETRRMVLTRPLARSRAVVPAGEYAVISVSDQGCGIAPEILGKVFEPFVTTKRIGEGTGLGLSTAYGIVKQSGGFIFVDSIVGKGTEFTIFLPAHLGEPAGAAVPVRAPSPRSDADRDGVILLVEDEAPVRAFAARALRLRGYTVLEAATAEEALETLENGGLEIDLFVSDVIMPGMDGPSWVRQARRKRPGTKAIFVSGYAEDLLSGADGGMENAVFLPKPFSLAQLTETVEAQLST